jgi:FAD-dependent oxidoreductase family protein
MTRKQNGGAIRDIDVLVVGGGKAGAFAALGAKARGLRVVIIEPHNVLGGQGTAGGVAGFCGDSARVNRPFAELVAILARHDHIKPYDPNADRRAYALDYYAFHLQEYVIAKGIDVLFHARVIGARADRGAVRTVDVSTGPGTFRYRPKMAVDATGECVLARHCGFRTFHEGANLQLPMSLYFTLWDTGKKVRSYLPPGCPRWRDDESIPMTTLHRFPSGKVEVKMKVVGFDAADGESLSRAEVHARRQMMGLIHYLQTHGYQGVKLDRHELASVSRQIGVREGRRIIGDHVLTEDEVMRGAIFEDAVAVGTYHLDYHWPDRPERAGTGITTHVESYHIPLRSLVPRGARNVLVAGRGASGDQMAMSSFRVMATCAQMGYAAGMAARECLREASSLRNPPIARIQRALERNGQDLDLSHYGEYLRKKTRVDEKFGRGEGQTALIQLKNNRFLVAWSRRRALWVSIREAGSWSRPQCVYRDGEISSVVLDRMGESTARLAFMVGDLAHACISRDGGNSWSQPRKRSAAVRAAKRSSMTLAPKTRVRAVVREAKAGKALCVELSRDGGRTWPARLTVAKGKGEFVCGSPITVGCGFAFVYQDTTGDLHFFKSSVEQIEAAKS